jgi:uncharacterized protein
MEKIKTKISLLHDNFQKKFEICYNNQIIMFDPLKKTIDSYVTSGITTWPYINFGEPGDSVQKIFKPVCLTLYLNNDCNLACGYCYIPNKAILPPKRINTQAVRSAAEIVALNCVEFGTPFILGFHGGNEPLLNPQFVNDCIEICREVAGKYNLTVLPHCTTNGVISEATAKWAGEVFHGITLSWDGPADIQDSWRHHKDNRSTSIHVERTAEILLNASSCKNLRVRSTVTQQSVDRLLEITQYFFERNIRQVEYYPVFLDLHQKINPQLIPHSAAFVKNFLLAKYWADQNNMRIGYAGSRIGEYHDKYCSVWQNNLTLTPDGYLTNCFLATHNHQHENDLFIYGCFDEKKGEMIIDMEKLAMVFQKNLSIHSQCMDCFNFFHCSKGCPTFCPIKTKRSVDEKIDCTIERWIGLSNVLQQAGYELPIDLNTDCQLFFDKISVKSINKGEKEKFV